uniref:CACTA en-spm transposon protein n=1 Tax=Cucumis melo TaxID=3656 RepID=A0A9I9E9T4_CUCME
MVEHDSRCTTQNSGDMVVGENNGDGSIDNNFYGTMAAFSSNFYESKNLFQELNISPHTGSLVGDTSNGSGPTRKTRDHSRNMELEKYICKHGKIPISITLGAEKSISSHVVLFSNTISVAIRDAFPIWLLRFADVPSKYIKIVKKFMSKSFERQIELRLGDAIRQFEMKVLKRHFKGPNIIVTLGGMPNELPSLSENKMHLNQSCRHATMDPTSLEPPWIRRSTSRGAVFGVRRSVSRGVGSDVRVCVRRSTFEWKLAFGVRRSVAFGIYEHRKCRRRSGRRHFGWVSLGSCEL